MSTQALNSTVEEILTPEDLKKLLENPTTLKHYIGFEISGKVHIGTGIMTMRVIKELQELGVQTSCFLADWHSYINKKLGGDIEVIREMALSYFKEALIASALCVGADPKKINFVLADDTYDPDYWLTTLDVASNITLSRGKRSVDIAGRAGGEDMPIAILFYPPMQVADIFHQGIHIAHAGTDQRKAHVVARDIAMKLRHKQLKNPDGEIMKPVALHHHLIQGLSQPPEWPIPEDKRREMLVSMKMSKSKPDTAVFIHDSVEEIERKIKKAFCPPEVADMNPIIDWLEHIIFPLQESFELERPEKFGGNKTYTAVDDLKADYISGDIHPGDLKTNVARYLVDILEPARKHFEDPTRRAALEKIESLKATR